MHSAQVLRCLSSDCPSCLKALARLPFWKELFCSGMTMTRNELVQGIGRGPVAESSGLVKGTASD